MARIWTLLRLWKIVVSVVLYTHMSSLVDAQDYNSMSCESQCQSYYDALDNCVSVDYTGSMSCYCNTLLGNPAQCNNLTVTRSGVDRYLLILIACYSCISSIDPSMANYLNEAYNADCNNAVPPTDPTVPVPATAVFASPVAATSTPAHKSGAAILSLGTRWL